MSVQAVHAAIVLDGQNRDQEIEQWERDPFTKKLRQEIAHVDPCRGSGLKVGSGR